MQNYMKDDFYAWKNSRKRNIASGVMRYLINLQGQINSTQCCILHENYEIMGVEPN